MKQELTLIKGIGEKKKEELNEIGIDSIEDLVTYAPCQYKSRGRLKDIDDCAEGEFILCEATCLKVGRTAHYQRTRSTTAISFDGGLVCVYFNLQYASNMFKEGVRYRLYGRVYMYRGKKSLINPMSEKADDVKFLTEGVYPVYDIPAKSKIRQKELTFYIRDALSKIDENDFSEAMPLSLILDNDLMGKYDSLKMMHVPYDLDEARASRRYFRFESFLSFRNFMDRDIVRGDGNIIDVSSIEKIRPLLPFTLTSSQEDVLEDIFTDLTSGKAMNRLLQGDVGSGKTVVCVIAAIVNALDHHQSVICAPTRVLISQHYEKYRHLIESLGLSCSLLTSDMTQKQTAKIKAELLDGRIDILFGTHSVFSDDVEYSDLGLIVIDEQQRYGVNQRSKLKAKGTNVHTLVMSATPIPRTLALSIYKDLDVSIIDKAPSNRAGIETFIMNAKDDDKVIGFIEKKAKEGLKTYVVCPAIDDEDMENVEIVYESVTKAIGTEMVAKLTGKTEPKEADRIMSRFNKGEIKVIIATSVIEVGVDDDKAVVMWIKGAERFGLSQLHQLRGRVGRGIYDSFCFLTPSRGVNKVPDRLKVIKENTDGFEIAKKDLQTRGSGDIAGVMQSGKVSSITDEIFEEPELFEKSLEAFTKLKSSTDDRSLRYLEYIKILSDKRFTDIVLN